MLISNLLLDRDSTGAASTGILTPDEHDVLLRHCIGSRVTHLLHTLPVDAASEHFDRLHSDFLNSHLNV